MPGWLFLMPPLAQAVRPPRVSFSNSQASSSLFFEKRGGALNVWELRTSLRPVGFGMARRRSTCEGRGAPAGAPIMSALVIARRCPCDRTPRLPALHVRFCKGRTYPPYRPQVRASWDARSASPHFAIPVQQAPCRAVVMPPGRVPKPPGGEGANLTRGRRASRNRRPPR